MVKKLRRAFTIVELVIVIAVIAILAAVLIPTFTSLIQKANQSNDTTNVKNMNTILTAAEATDGKAETMYDAVQIIKEGGYDLSKLTPTGEGYDIVWDQEYNRLALVNDEEVVFSDSQVSTEKWKLWIVTDEQIETEYSVYLNDGFAGDSYKAASGVDVGENEGINVTIENAGTKDLKVRTNGGTLGVYSSEVSVSHYETADMADIGAVADKSYHEFGTVTGNVYLAQGRFVAENGSNVGALVVTADVADVVSVVVSENASIQNIAVTNESIKDTLSVTGSDLEIQVVADEMFLQFFGGGLGTEASPFVISTEEHFGNIGYLSGDFYVKLENDLHLLQTLSTKDEAQGLLTLHLDLNGKLITVEQTDGKSLYAIDNYGVLYLYDSSEAQSGTIRARGIENYGTMYLLSGTIESCDSNGGGAAVWNEGTFEMTGGTLAFTGEIYNNGTGLPLNVQAGAKAVITGGNIISDVSSIFVLGELELSNVTLANNTAYWNCIKVFAGGTAVLDNVVINSDFGGGIEVAGGNATLRNCEFHQRVSDTQVSKWNSTCAAVSSGGTLTIESGIYESVMYGVYVFNSGGTINILGGNFNASGTVLKADNSTTSAKSIINVSGGTFNGAISIGSASELNLTGGEFSVQPDAKYVEEGYVAEQSGDKWVVKAQA